MPTCCYGCFRTSIDKGAFKIAFFGAALGIVHAFGAFVSGNIPTGVGSAFSAILYLSVIWALDKHNLAYFMPYLIIAAIGLILCIPAAIFFALSAFSAGAIGILLLILFVIAWGVNVWFYSIIYRAYKFMQNQQQREREQQQSSTAQPPQFVGKLPV